MADWQRFYVPEIHDIHPAMVDRLDDLMGLWPQAALERVALLVVPNWMGEVLLSQDRLLCERLAAAPGMKVLHGWTHSLGPDLWNWVFYGHDNRSEFARLSAAEAHERLSQGVDMLSEIFGAGPKWFCAPRWQQSPAATKALEELGFTGYMLNRSLVTFGEQPVALRALCFDEGPRRTKAALLRHLREGTIDRLITTGTPFRFTLHPDDVTDAPTWGQVRRLMARLQVEGWEAVSFEEALARHRNLQAARAQAA